MTTRHDVSTVPLQSASVAKQCPVRAQNETLQPAVPVPASPFLQHIWDRGSEYERRIFAEIAAFNTNTLVVAEDDPDPARTTNEAMQRGVPLILRGKLPDDAAGHRKGRPDILVAGDGGYRAVDVKSHMQLEPRRQNGKSAGAHVCALSGMSFESAAESPDHAAQKREEDLLQLAHYQRMLEALGLAAADGRFAGIIGTEGMVVWYDLDAPMWRTPSNSAKSKLRSTMERYDFEFDFRLDIVAVAERHKKDPSVPLLVVPVRITECGRCPWWEYCRPQLELGPGDVSLLPRIGWREWKIHRDHGVNNRRDLASLDHYTAELVAEGASGEKLRDFHTKTASYSDCGMASLPEQIDLARASLGPEPVYRRRGVAELVIPRADIEVDVDMENTEAGAYLFGGRLSVRNGVECSEFSHGYQSFVTWDPITPEIEADNTLRLWQWLMAIREWAAQRQKTFKAYCYNANAENLYLRRMGQVIGISEAVNTFIASEEWVDMLKIFDSQFITGGSNGLKSVAMLAGHHWDVEDAGGSQSMVMYETAVSDGGDAPAAREWLLKYNQGDVDATFQLREWLEKHGSEIPGIESLD